MEIRCSKCSHLAAAADVLSVDGGVGLVCAECGHINIAAAAGDEEVATKSVDGADGTTAAAGEDFVERSMARLVPKPGSGKRCPKCAHLLQEDADNCGRCGLSLEEASRHPEGEAPWETAPEGLEDAQEAAQSMWESIADGEEGASIADFVDFTIEAGLIDYGIRQLQFFLVDQPDDREALAGLRRLAESLKVAVQIAQTQAEAKADEFNDDVKRFRTNLLVAALLFWTVILLLFSWLFWDKF